MAREVPDGLRVFINNVLGGWYAQGGVCVIRVGPGWVHLDCVKRQGSEAKPLHECGELAGGIEAHGGGIVLKCGPVAPMESREEEIGLDGTVQVYLY